MQVCVVSTHFLLTLFQNTLVSTRPWEPSTSFSPASAEHADWKRTDASRIARVTLGEMLTGPPISQPLILQEQVAFGYFDCKMSLQEGFMQTSQLLEPPRHNPQHEHSTGSLGEANINSTLLSGSRKQRGKCQINMKTTVRKVFGAFEGTKCYLLMMRKGVRHVILPEKGLYIV